MVEAKILLQEVTPNPSPLAGDLHFPRELLPLRIAGLGAAIEVPAEQAAAPAIRINMPDPRIAQPEPKTIKHSLYSRNTFS